ncbi:lysophospholipid acyltransferase family protein [Eisenibacter elegans]|uniref:lysophospholipid acyltransferase family protein n=1 Tax=Eisenibacter elegans TaxID=997 RepID=UPI0003FD822B|nr:lysophospholipid acyltransferase family protein [Eisenibacter elegans]
MRIVLGWLTTPIFLLLLGLILLVFDVVQRIALNVFGYQAHKLSIDLTQRCILGALNITGARFRFENLNPSLPTDRPIIMVSNHQSLFDIPMNILLLRKHHVKFVSKKELGRGIPTISYNLRYGGSVLIDRKKPEEAKAIIAGMGQYIEKYKRTACIYPEGSRARNGQLKPFKVGGLATLLENAPSALVVPVVIENSWKIVRYNFKPIPFGVKCSVTALEAIEPAGWEPEALLQEIAGRISERLGQPLPQSAKP